MLRLPAVCNFNPDTVVAAHIRTAGVGIGRKPSDLCTIRCCSACHDVLDGRVMAKHITDGELAQYTLEALCRQLEQYVREGLVNVK